jgi:hypothetical protein
MKQALVFAAAFGLLATSPAAQAGQFKNVNIDSISNPGCVTVHSSPQNQGPALTAVMEIETFEFTTPAADGYKCCIISNATNQKLIVRLMNLSATPVSNAITPVVNGTACTGFVGLNSAFAYQCTVSGLVNSPVAPNAHYVLNICRQ